MTFHFLAVLVQLLNASVVPVVPDPAAVSVNLKTSDILLIINAVAVVANTALHFRRRGAK
jgi:hypothetical protein